MMTAAPAADVDRRPTRPILPGRAGRIGALILALWLLPALASGEQPAALTFDLLSYNIRNLPNTGFEARRAAIEAILPEYDLVVLQEDFEPDPLRDAWPDRDRVAAGPEAAYRWYHLLAPVGWVAGYPVPYDSGLSVLAAGRSAVRGVRTISRLPYSDCHGLFGAGLDCWATKGLLGVRVALANGATVDVYTTHLDAGGHPASVVARWNQLDAMVDEIGTVSAGRALIVAGDFNAPLRRPDDRTALDAALAALGLTSAQATARNQASHDCQVVQIYYRSIPGTRLELVRAGERAVTLPEPYVDGMNFCSGDRRIYGPSDHPALTATFRVTADALSLGEVTSEPAPRPFRADAPD
jgi:endonuclease/exonuclease/phosphatase family metal-dependent hydrolase